MSMHYKLLLLLFLLHGKTVNSQPYLDVVNVRYLQTPQSSDETKLSYLNLSTTLPLVLTNKDAFIVSPYVERWRLHVNNTKSNYYGVALPVSFLKNFNDRWSVLTTGIIRWNDSSVLKQMHTQVGGAFIVSHNVHTGLTYKAGLYVNDEFFGLFIMPLLGIDWQINKKDCLFGVLPGHLTYQHEVSKWIKYGFSFRAQTNSYYRPVENFIRINENQLGSYVDFYLTKHIVLNLEAGHSILRKLRFGKTAGCHCKYIDNNMKDNVYFKLAFAYRIALR